MTQEIAFLPFLLEPSWQKELLDELQKPYLLHLAAFVKDERAKGLHIYPPEELVFNAFQTTPFHKVKVAIMGQDPYHGPKQAHGLSFSVPQGVPAPPSLQNIFKELEQDLKIPIPSHGCLLKWAEQGVLLLNATLTVRESEPLSHHKRGWEQFTDACMRRLALRKEPVIFVLWGKNAIEKSKHVPELYQNKQHTILTAAHPSPFSAHSGFFGCRHFSKINNILEKLGQPLIDWRLE